MTDASRPVDPEEPRIRALVRGAMKRGCELVYPLSVEDILVETMLCAIREDRCRVAEMIREAAEESKWHNAEDLENLACVVETAWFDE